MRQALTSVGLTAMVGALVTLANQQVGNAQPTHIAVGRGPVVMPTSRKIAFTNDLDGSLDIYVALKMKTGTSIKQLTDDPALDHSPSWSPDGTRIVFVSTRDHKNGEIYTMKADGSDVQRLTVSQEEDRDPAWSPKGNRIVWTRIEGGEAELWTIKPDGSDARVIPRPVRGVHPQIGRAACWSPGGGRLAFHRIPPQSIGLPGDAPTHIDIYRVKADGKGLTQLTDSYANDTSPTWSPDGDLIAFQRKTTLSQIYVMTSDGESLTLISTASTGAIDPFWSSDDNRIYFCAWHDGHHDVFSIKANGSAMRQEVSIPGDNTDPAVFVPQ